jgi:hypothetical protein
MAAFQHTSNPPILLELLLQAECYNRHSIADLQLKDSAGTQLWLNLWQPDTVQPAHKNTRHRNNLGIGIRIGVPERFCMANKNNLGNGLIFLRILLSNPYKFRFILMYR